jgi:hypothetical protein
MNHCHGYSAAMASTVAPHHALLQRGHKTMMEAMTRTNIRRRRSLQAKLARASSLYQALAPNSI